MNRYQLLRFLDLYTISSPVEEAGASDQDHAKITLMRVEGCAIVRHGLPLSLKKTLS